MKMVLTGQEDFNYVKWDFLVDTFKRMNDQRLDL